MSVVWAPMKEYVFVPLQNEVQLLSEDLGNVNSWLAERVFDLTGSRKAASITGVFISVLVVTVPYFLLPWQVMIGALAAYQLSTLKLPTFERDFSIAAFLDMTRQLVFFAAKNLAKQSGALAHVGTAAGTCVVAVALLIQSAS